jgi:hypothetical protein
MGMRCRQKLCPRAMRYGDAQLHALALYLYSLRPPPNPHRFDYLAARRKRIFERTGCSGCHTSPLYTNNKLVPVDGFEVPADHKHRFDILEARVGTDPRYGLQTHKGTGYYKVPSLKGVWYRGTLEDWLDPARLRDDYEPTGYKGLRRQGPLSKRPCIRPRAAGRGPPSANRVFEDSLKVVGLALNLCTQVVFVT